MRKTKQEPYYVQVVENGPNLGIDFNGYHPLPSVPMSKSNKKAIVPDQVKLTPNAREKAVLQAGMEKFGLKKAQDIVSMALRQFEEKEQLFKAS